MAAILQTIFSNVFSWLKIYEFRLDFIEVCPINNIPELFIHAGIKVNLRSLS